MKANNFSGDRFSTASKSGSANTDRLAAALATLNNLSPDLGRNRVLGAEASAAYWGVSLPHWRRLYRAGKVPRPIKVGERKLGWRIGDLVDGLAKRVDSAA